MKNSVNLKSLMWNWLTDLSKITQTGLVYQNGKEKMVYNLWVTYVNWE